MIKKKKNTPASVNLENTPADVNPENDLTHSVTPIILETGESAPSLSGTSNKSKNLKGKSVAYPTRLFVESNTMHPPICWCLHDAH